jgi:hypothetical protein
MRQDDPPSGVSDENESDPAMSAMVIRTWNEPDQAPAFRARLTYSQAPDEDPRTISTADPDEVLRLVRQWLDVRSAPPRHL